MNFLSNETIIGTESLKMHSKMKNICGYNPPVAWVILVTFVCSDEKSKIN